MLEGISICDLQYRYSWRGFDIIFYGISGEERFVIISEDRIIYDNFKIKRTTINDIMISMDEGTASSELYSHHISVKSARK